MSRLRTGADYLFQSNPYIAPCRALCEPRTSRWMVASCCSFPQINSWKVTDPPALKITFSKKRTMFVRVYAQVDSQNSTGMKWRQQGENISSLLTWPKEIFLKHDWLKKMRLPPPSLSKAVRYKEGGVFFFEPVLFQKYRFGSSHWLRNCSVLRERKVHFWNFVYFPLFCFLAPVTL